MIRVLPLRSTMTEIDEYVMCAAPALSRAAPLRDKESPFRQVHIVLATEIGAELSELSERLQTVDATPFIGYQPGRWWQGRIPVLLGPPPGLPTNSVSSFCGTLSTAIQPPPAGSACSPLFAGFVILQ